MLWQGKLKDGKFVNEIHYAWSEVKEDIAQLEFLMNDNRVISLPKNMEKYIQAKSASADLGGNNIEIESRYIGFSLGNNIVKVRVNEKNKNISIEVE